MPKHQLAILIIATGTAIAPAAGAQAETGRYTMTPTKDGVLKLDTFTGSVSLCQRQNSGWACEGIEDSNSRLQDRIRELESENRQLRSRLEAQKMAPAQPESGKLEIPSEQDVDKAMDFMERILKRFKGMVEDLNKDKQTDEEGVPL